MRKTISIVTLITAIVLFFLLPAGYGQNLKKLEKLEQEKKELKHLSAGERHEIMQELRKAIRMTLQDDLIHETLKETIITGNQIRVLLTNQGSISTPDADNASADLVWPQGADQLGYAYEFGPLVGAEVPHAFIPDSMVHIVNDGFLARTDGDFQPGTTTRWGWLPRVGFSDPASKEVATFSDLDSNLDGKPDSWPPQWYNETLGRYVWPAFLGDDATTPDEEVFYVMDDYNNAEFAYYPFPDDSSRRGLGLELQVRLFQFNNPLAEDIVFLVYTITNTSPKTLDKVYLGMFGDPHVGGPFDFNDDDAYFISAFNEAFPFKARNMLYAEDHNHRGDGGRIPGIFGYRFLESPGIDDDGEDNDNDGLLDESSFNDAGTEIFGPVGIYGEPKLHWSGDEDGDWNPKFDDVGVDGIAGTGDLGEGDGRPTQLFFLDLNNNAILDAGEPTSQSRLEGMRFLGGEPNFGFLDIAESDQLGLTSFNAILFGGNNRPNNDPLMWQLMSTDNQRPEDPPPQIEQQTDNVFIYGCGPFRLRPGESRRFSIALLLGVDLNDLIQNAITAQDVFESDYRFAKPPIKPHLAAVPGDRKVTLYWDTGAEASFDPFVARANPDDPDKGFDFEGYRIYRSQDYSFNDTKTITDSRGIPFLSVPLRQANGVPAQFDLINEFSGLAEIEYKGRGVRFDLGTNNGLVHSFVDSNNVMNGATYYYTVTSYDHGDLKGELAPSESQRTIQRDALTRKFTFDVNTAMVVPGPPATGFVGPGLMEGSNVAQRLEGNATGTVRLQVLDPFAVVDGKKYEVNFEQLNPGSPTATTGYSVFDLEQRTTTFIARDTLSVNLLVDNLVEGSVTITTQTGTVVDPANYSVDYKQGRIRGTRPGTLPSGQSFRATYRFKPVAESTALSSEDNNPVFDGVKVFVQNEATALDPARSGFKIKNSNTNLRVEAIGLATAGNPRPYPSDFEIHFTNYDTVAEVNGRLISPADTSVLTRVATPFKIFDASTGKQIDFYINETNPRRRNQRWDWQETIVLLVPDAPIPNTTYQVKFAPPSDTLKTADGTRDSITVDQPIYPRQGDVFLFFSKKPFDPGDRYAFTTRAAKFEAQGARNALADVYVVPNPYIAYSAAEIAAPRSGERDDRRLEFRNLPQRCTIRIYTITGELVDTIEKDDNRDFAVWDLLTFEAQQTAYGVYIYHVDAPNVGTKIGRFALIK